MPSPTNGHPVHQRSYQKGLNQYNEHGIQIRSVLQTTHPPLTREERHQNWLAHLPKHYKIVRRTIEIFFRNIQQTKTGTKNLSKWTKYFERHRERNWLRLDPSWGCCSACRITLLHPYIEPSFSYLIIQAIPGMILGHIGAHSGRIRSLRASLYSTICCHLKKTEYNAKTSPWYSDPDILWDHREEEAVKASSDTQTEEDTDSTTDEPSQSLLRAECKCLWSNML